MHNPITKRQRQVLEFVRSYTKQKGFSPSLQEIASHLRLKSVATVHEHLEKLKMSGYLNKLKNQRRSATIYGNKTIGLVEIPLLGIISAGGPIEAISNPEPIEVPSSTLSGNAKHYALKVSGISMIEEGISDGDIIIVRGQPNVENGEKAVAYLPDRNAVTLKKIYRERGRVKLVPANKTMKPFYEKNVEIQGKVVGVLRKES